jgi:hypothetical protein
MPLNVDFTTKESKGDGISTDLCNKVIMFKYWGIDPNRKDLDKSTAYKATKCGLAGTRGNPNILQNDE